MSNAKNIIEGYSTSVEEWSLSELINALLGGIDEDEEWKVYFEFHQRESSEVFERAGELCRSRCPLERSTGAQMLGQLGSEKSAYSEHSVDLLIGMLESEKVEAPLNSILLALAGHHDLRIVEHAARFRSHPQPEVRRGAVLALSGYDDPLAIRSLIELSADENVHARDWATFGLGTQIETDTKMIREALFRRLDDVDEYVRGEALVGLALRRDPGVIPFLKRELGTDVLTYQALEAAEIAADSTLHESLIAWNDRGSGLETSLADAIRACSPLALEVVRG